MKTIRSSLFAIGLLTLIASNGCKKNESTPAEQKIGSAPVVSAAAAVSNAAPVSAEKTSFQQVTSQLDPGGNVYFYLSTEQWLEGLAGKVAGLRQLLGAIPDLKPEDGEKLEQAFVVVTNLIKNSGIEDVSGFGMSSIATEKGFYHSKAMLHHYKGKGSGFLWTMFGQKPHALDGLSLLPTNTALATFSDLEIPILWQTIRDQAAQSGIPQAAELLNKLPEGFEKTTGLKWDQVLASLGGEFGVALTLDDEKMISLPIPGADVLEIPNPALMLVAKVKDDLIFNRIDKALKSSGQQVVSVDKPDLKMRTVPLPLPLPIQLAPTVALSGGYLFIATTDTIIQEALAVKSGQTPGLKSTGEFQHLANGTPQQGNHFTFMSRRFGETFGQIQKKALAKAASSSTGASKQWMQSLVGSGPASFAYTVGGHTEEGWLTVANGNQHPAKLFLVSAVVPVGMLSAIAIPNFVKARSTAQKNACITNLRQIAAAKQQWALENKKADTDTPTKTDLLPFLTNQQFPVCPGKGDYTINPVSTPPQCSLPGHSIAEH